MTQKYVVGYNDGNKFKAIERTKYISAVNKARELNTKYQAVNLSLYMYDNNGNFIGARAIKGVL